MLTAIDYGRNSETTGVEQFRSFGFVPNGSLLSVRISGSIASAILLQFAIESLCEYLPHSRPFYQSELTIGLQWLTESIFPVAKGRKLANWFGQQKSDRTISCLYFSGKALPSEGSNDRLVAKAGATLTDVSDQSVCQPYLNPLRTKSDRSSWTGSVAVSKDR